MARLIGWIIWLVFLFMLCVMQSRRVLLTPQFAFVGCFIPQALGAVYFVEEWSLSFCNATMFVLMGGVLLFFVVSVIYEFFYLELHPLTSTSVSLDGKQRDSASKIYVNKGILWILLIVQITTLLLSLYYINIRVKSGTLIEKVARVSWMAKFAEEDEWIELPFLINQLRVFCHADVFVFSYLLAHGIVLRYKNNRALLALNLLAGCCVIISTGNRGQLIALAIASVVQGYIIWGRANNWSRSISVSFVLKVLIAFCVIMVLLYETLALFGRSTDMGIIEYLGSYLSASLKNFDIFMREGKFGCEFKNTVTFFPLTGTLGRYFNMPELLHVNDLPYRSVNGISLGNVYTVFYPYLHDGGVLGLVILLSLMAVISQRSFLKAAYGKAKHGINIQIIFYSYMFQTIVLSFFSDRFYSYIFSVSIIKYLLSWWLLRILLAKVKIRKLKIVVSKTAVHRDNVQIGLSNK